MIRAALAVQCTACGEEASGLWALGAAAGSSQRRKHRVQGAAAAYATSGGADGRSTCLGSLGRGAGLAGVGQAGIRARTQHHLKQKSLCEEVNVAEKHRPLWLEWAGAQEKGLAGS